MVIVIPVLGHAQPEKRIPMRLDILGVGRAAGESDLVCNGRTVRMGLAIATSSYQVIETCSGLVSRHQDSVIKPSASCLSIERS